MFKCVATCLHGLGVCLSFLSMSQRCSGNQAPGLLPVSPMYKCLHKLSTFYAMNDNSGGACKVISDFNRSLGTPEILSMLRMKLQVLHRARAFKFTRMIVRFKYASD